MEIVFSDEARDYVVARGGSVYVRAAQRNCCGGALVLLDVSTDAPGDSLAYVPYSTDDVDVYYHGRSQGVPSQLVIELRGRLRPHLAAYKDGCVFPL